MSRITSQVKSLSHFFECFGKYSSYLIVTIISIRSYFDFLRARLTGQSLAQHYLCSGIVCSLYVISKIKLDKHNESRTFTSVVYGFYIASQIL